MKFALAFLFFSVLDPIRLLFSLNLGTLPQWLKLLYIRVLVDRLGYPFLAGDPSYQPRPALNRQQRRALFFRLPRKVRLHYAGLLTAAGLAGVTLLGAPLMPDMPTVSGGATIVGSRSGLFWKQTPGGLPVIQDAKAFTGNVFFVDASAPAAQRGTTSGFGTHPDRPLSTVDSAVDLCTSSQGDAIFVLAGHTESWAAAAVLTLDKIGVSVIGLGTGNNRPTFTATDAAVDVEVDSASCGIYNCRFITDVASLTALVDVDAAAFTLEDCLFIGNNAATETNLITVITDANADDLTVRRCEFNYLATVNATVVTTTSTECIRLVGADRAEISDNYISGDFTTSAINGITTASKDVQIVRNRIHNIATEDIAGIVDLVAACNGVIAYNYGFFGLHDDASALALIIDPSSCAMVENYFSNVVTEAGGLVGTAST